MSVATEALNRQEQHAESLGDYIRRCVAASNARRAEEERKAKELQQIAERKKNLAWAPLEEAIRKAIPAVVWDHLDRQCHLFQESASSHRVVITMPRLARIEVSFGKSTDATWRVSIGGYAVGRVNHDSLEEAVAHAADLGDVLP